MARKRYIHSKISTDGAVARLSMGAALLYTWGFPHADDDCRIPAKSPDELLLLVMPGMKQLPEQIASYLTEIMDEGLMGQDIDGRYFYPADTFYKIQTVINKDNRRATPEISRKQRRTAEIAKEQQETTDNAEDRQESQVSPENTVSSSSSVPVSSPVPVSFTRALTRSSGARAGLRVVTDDNKDDLGLGDKHPGNIVGWDIWNKYEETLAQNGKRLGVYNLELISSDLKKWQAGGSDPELIVKKALANGWVTLHDLDAKDRAPPGGESTAAALARIEAIANGGS